MHSIPVRNSLQLSKKLAIKTLGGEMRYISARRARKVRKGDMPSPPASDICNRRMHIYRVARSVPASYFIFLN